MRICDRESVRDLRDEPHCGRKVPSTSNPARVFGIRCTLALDHRSRLYARVAGGNSAPTARSASNRVPAPHASTIPVGSLVQTVGDYIQSPALIKTKEHNTVRQAVLVPACSSRGGKGRETSFRGSSTRSRSTASWWDHAHRALAMTDVTIWSGSRSSGADQGRGFEPPTIVGY